MIIFADCRKALKLKKSNNIIVEMHAKKTYQQRYMHMGLLEKMNSKNSVLHFGLSVEACLNSTVCLGCGKFMPSNFKELVFNLIFLCFNINSNILLL